jgi:hypothetical protein
VCSKYSSRLGVHVLDWFARRHRWTGRYEAHLWDNSCRREGQSRKGRQGNETKIHCHFSPAPWHNIFGLLIKHCVFYPIKTIIVFVHAMPTDDISTMCSLSWYVCIDLFSSYPHISIVIIDVPIFVIAIYHLCP